MEIWVFANACTNSLYKRYGTSAILKFVTNVLWLYLCAVGICSTFAVRMQLLLCGESKLRKRIMIRHFHIIGVHASVSQFCRAPFARSAATSCIRDHQLNFFYTNFYKILA